MLRQALRSAFLALVALLLVPGPASAAVDSSAGQEARAGGWWGGTYTVGTGEQVRVLLSDTYPVDEARARYWAETLAGLVHGPELSRLTAHFAPIDEVRRLCGPWAAGCYSPVDQSLLVPGETSDGISAEAVLAHEYGHHVANNRANPPWNGLDWGPKRWASYARICPRERSGTAFPGRDDRYRLQPGEAFAEAYRVLNETRAGGVDFTWSVVDGSFRPDANALRLVYDDVVHPWKPTGRRIAGAFRTGSARVHETLLPTPYDGVLAATLAGPRRYRIQIVDPFSGRVLAEGRRLERTVCGERSLLLRVVSDGTAARFSIRISRP
jgi:hypothetical protein